MPESKKAAKGRLTREQSAMWRQENRGNIKGKPKEEKKAFQKTNLEKLAAMSESEIGALRTQLQTKWDALPAEKKKKLEQKLNKREARGGKGQKKKRKGRAGEGE